jgi:hypothetical protein
VQSERSQVREDPLAFRPKPHLGEVLAIAGRVVRQPIDAAPKPKDPSGAHVVVEQRRGDPCRRGLRGREQPVLLLRERETAGPDRVLCRRVAARSKLKSD